jgi:hypothetical protein
MHHKRGKPKSSRAGCLLCYPHKHQRAAWVPRSPREQAELSEPIEVPDAGELRHDLWAERVEHADHVCGCFECERYWDDCDAVVDLSEDEYQRLLDIIDNPPAPTFELRELMRGKQTAK